MKQILRHVLVAIIGLVGLYPAPMLAAGSVNGLLTFTEISASQTPAVAGKDKITIKGSGFNHVQQVIMVQQNSPTINIFNVLSYSLTDSKIAFTIPAETTAGNYTLQLNTDDATGRTALFNDQVWSVDITASGKNSFALITPNGGQEYNVGGNINFKWNSGLGDYTYKKIYLTLFKLKSDNWALTSDPYSYLEGEEYRIQVLSGDAVDDGKHNWRIASSTPTGKYVALFTIQYGTNTSISNLSDWSDQPFTIKPKGAVAATPSTTQPINTQPSITMPSNSVAVLAVPDTNTGLAEAFTEGAAHPVGTNVMTKAGAVYRITEGPGRSLYPSANVFLSYKFNKFADVAKATTGDIALPVVNQMPPLDGSLMSDKGVVYIISEGKARQPFGSEAVFKGYGYSFKYVFPADTSYLETYPVMTSSDRIHPDGTLIYDKGTYYIMNSRQRLGIPSLAVLESWGYWVEDAVPANKYDLATTIGGIMGMRPSNQYRY